MTRFERWAVWATSIATAVTGFGYMWTKYFVTVTDPWAAVNHPLEPWFLRVHVVTAPLFVFAFGLIAVRHVWKHIVTGVPHARRTGLATALFVLPMIVTGYLIQVVTHVGWLRAIVIAHLVCGTVYVIGIAAHRVALAARAGAAEGAPAGETRGLRRTTPPGPERSGAESEGTTKPDRLEPRKVG